MKEKTHGIENKERANPLKKHPKFTERVIRTHVATSTNLASNKPVDTDAIVERAINTVDALEPEDAIQLMLITQMSAVHELQQKLVCYTNSAADVPTMVSNIGAISKLSNLFIQQVNLLHKLKSGNQQKVVFEHVHVHSGGQAVVGSIHHPPTPLKVKT